MCIPNQSAPLTSYQFLFGKEAGELKGIDLQKVPAILGLLEKYAVTLFKQGQLSCFDALGGNNQCHLTALTIIDFYRRLQQNQLQIEVGSQTNENRFLQLTFLTSSFFYKHKENTLKVLLSDQTDLKNSNVTIKEVAQFLNNPVVMQEAKQQLAQKIQELIQLYFKEPTAQDLPSSLSQELNSLSKEELISQGAKQASPLYCYPKYAGVLLLLQQLEEQKIPLFFKVKVLCKEGGHHIRLYSISPSTQTLQPCVLLTDSIQTPALIIEGFSGHHAKINMDSYGKIRALCPHGLLSDKPGTKSTFQFHTGRIHKLDVSCQACKPCEDKTCSSIQEFEQRLQKVAIKGFDVLRLSAADFTAACQKDYVQRFFDPSSSYPSLAYSFQKALAQAKELGFFSQQPATFLIEHVYADTVEQMQLKSRLLDQPGIEHIRTIKQVKKD